MKTNDEGEEEYHPYFSDNEFSVVVNSNRLLIVEDVCYKIFDDGIVVVHKNELNSLSSLEGNYAANIRENDKILISLFEDDEISPKSSCDPNRNVEEVDNGRNRTKLKLRAHSQIHSISMDGNGGITSITTRVRTFGRIRPYMRTLGVWFHARRTISGRIEYQVKYLRGSTHEIDVNEQVSSTLSYSQFRGETDISPANSHATNIRFTDIDSWGTTPSTGTVSVECSN